MLRIAEVPRRKRTAFRSKSCFTSRNWSKGRMVHFLHQQQVIRWCARTPLFHEILPYSKARRTASNNWLNQPVVPCLAATTLQVLHADVFAHCHNFHRYAIHGVDRDLLKRSGTSHGLNTKPFDRARFLLIFFCSTSSGGRLHTYITYIHVFPASAFSLSLFLSR